MSYLLFFIYLIALSWILTKIGFIKRSGLGNKVVILLFLSKVAVGLIWGRITEHVPHMDTWIYHQDALTEYRLLFNSPVAYFTNIFQSGYEHKYVGVFQFHDSFWNDLKTNLIVKFISVLDCASGGNYYTNVILYNFLVFFGFIALFRVFKQIFPNDNLLVITGVFLLPSTLLFSSIIHKEGLIMAAIGLLFFSLLNVFSIGNITVKRATAIFFSPLVIFLFRSYLLLLLIPGLAAWYAGFHNKQNSVVITSIIYTVFLLLFFNIHRVVSSVDLPLLVVQKQEDFFALETARSYVLTNKLLPNAGSFLNNLPEALAHSLGRPFLVDYKLSVPLLFFAIELIFYQFLFVLFVFFRKQTTQTNPFLCASIFFALSVLLIIGYTVPVIWAIVRYRSIYLPFFLVPLLCSINWIKLGCNFQSKK